MSCFLVSSATIHDVVALLADFADGPADLDALGQAL
jgi:hypothetical protein